jgi:hypothetical protein
MEDKKSYEKNNKVRSTAIFVVKNNDENKTKVQRAGILNELKIRYDERRFLLGIKV